MKSLFETLAPLCAGAALLTGCGGAPTPVNAAEVPAAVEVKPSEGTAAPVESKTGGATAGSTTTAAPATAPAPSSAVSKPAAPAKAAAASAAPKAKKVVAVKKDASASCGAGTCG